jgi:hypothetical protein
MAKIKSYIILHINAQSKSLMPSSAIFYKDIYLIRFLFLFLSNFEISIEIVPIVDKPTLITT